MVSVQRTNWKLFRLSYMQAVLLTSPRFVPLFSTIDTIKTTKVQGYMTASLQIPATFLVQEGSDGDQVTLPVNADSITGANGLKIFISGLGAQGPFRIVPNRARQKIKSLSSPVRAHYQEGDLIHMSRVTTPWAGPRERFVYHDISSNLEAILNSRRQARKITINITGNIDLCILWKSMGTIRKLAACLDGAK
ncbi:hypothetical protein P691DRAFT_836448 [Macrolepiota fuliginosa MF-IS2]|uniref:Uncharacterized protein n=1 Tax=Macrolepiota fuliginosa MF-IS2 TaxID=1400762 RepID=A0A9P5X4Z8_9AGAR|nr:hypothetical protein P691DRAFT_836448 [Macrolepiota fuliginosa MF-IS2]